MNQIRCLSHEQQLYLCAIPCLSQAPIGWPCAGSTNRLTDYYLQWKWMIGTRSVLLMRIKMPNTLPSHPVVEFQVYEVRLKCHVQKINNVELPEKFSFSR